MTEQKTRLAGDKKRILNIAMKHGWYCQKHFIEFGKDCWSIPFIVTKKEVRRIMNDPSIDKIKIEIKMDFI